MPSSPITGIASATTTPRIAIGRTTSGQNASAPSIEVGDVITPPNTSRSDHATSATPIAAVTRRPSRRPDATSALPHTATTAAPPVARPAAIQPATSSPMVIRDALGDKQAGQRPTDEPDHRDPADLPVGRRAQHHRAVRRREEHVVHVGRFEREWPAARTRAQPERDGHGDDEPDDCGAVVAQLLDGSGLECGVAHDRGRGEQRPQRHDRRDVRLVRDLDPVEVVQPPGAPTSLQRVERFAGLGGRQDHSADTTEGLPGQPSRSMTVALA